MGMYDDDQWGACVRHTDANIYNTRLIAMCEGCVNVSNRVREFEFITHESFGCVEYMESPIKTTKQLTHIVDNQ